MKHGLVFQINLIGRGGRKRGGSRTPIKGTHERLEEKKKLKVKHNKMRYFIMKHGIRSECNLIINLVG